MFGWLRRWAWWTRSDRMGALYRRVVDLDRYVSGRLACVEDRLEEICEELTPNPMLSQAHVLELASKAFDTSLAVQARVAHLENSPDGGAETVASPELQATIKDAVAAMDADDMLEFKAICTFSGEMRSRVESLDRRVKILEQAMSHHIGLAERAKKARAKKARAKKARTKKARTKSRKG